MQDRRSGQALLAFIAMSIAGTWAAASSAADTEEVTAIRACLADAADAMNCVGLTVGACTEKPDGDTTAGMVGCIGAETDAWDLILNEEYGTTMSQLRAADATGDLAAPDLTREGTLRQAQRAWVAFRDAECRAQYALWGSGTLRQVVGANCVMTETAERAIELREMRQP